MPRSGGQALNIEQRFHVLSDIFPAQAIWEFDQIFAVSRELTGKSVAVMWDAIAVSWDRIVDIRECAGVLWDPNARYRFRVELERERNAPTRKCIVINVRGDCRIANMDGETHSRSTHHRSAACLVDLSGYRNGDLTLEKSRRQNCESLPSDLASCHVFQPS